MTKEKELKNKNVIKKVDGKIQLKRESSDQESGNKKKYETKWWRGKWWQKKL